MTKPWQPFLCPQQKKLIKILLYRDTNMAAMASSANTLLDGKDNKNDKAIQINWKKAQ